MVSELRSRMMTAISAIVGGAHAVRVIEAIEPMIDEHVEEQRREAFAEGDDCGYNDASERD